MTPHPVIPPPSWVRMEVQIGMGIEDRGTEEEERENREAGIGIGR